MTAFAGIFVQPHTLLAVMQDTAAPAPSRVTAARAILDMSLRAVDVESFEVRLQVLEGKRQEMPR